jgi:hypothetical protein
MRARSNRALSRGTRAQHMMAPPTRGWLGLSSTSICNHPQASSTLVLRHRQPQVHSWGGGCRRRRAQTDAWWTTDIMGITDATLAWAPQPVNERNCRSHASRTA